MNIHHKKKNNTYMVIVGFLFALIVTSYFISSFVYKATM